MSHQVFSSAWDALKPPWRSAGSKATPVDITGALRTYWRPSGWDEQSFEGALWDCEPVNLTFVRQTSVEAGCEKVFCTSTKFPGCTTAHPAQCAPLSVALAMTVERGSQVSDRILKEPSKGGLARAIRSGLLISTVKKIQRRWLEPISLQNIDSTGAIHKTYKRGRSLTAWDFILGQGWLRKPQWTLITLLPSQTVLTSPDSFSSHTRRTRSSWPILKIFGTWGECYICHQNSIQMDRRLEAKGPSIMWVLWLLLIEIRKVSVQFRTSWFTCASSVYCVKLAPSPYFAGNRLKSPFVLSLCSCAQWPALYAIDQDVFW